MCFCSRFGKLSEQSGLRIDEFVDMTDGEPSKKNAFLEDFVKYVIDTGVNTFGQQLVLKCTNAQEKIKKEAVEYQKTLENETVEYHKKLLLSLNDAHERQQNNAGFMKVIGNYSAKFMCPGDLSDTNSCVTFLLGDVKNYLAIIKVDRYGKEVRVHDSVGQDSGTIGECFIMDC